MSSDNLDKLILDDTEYQTQLTKKFLSRKKYIPKDPKKLTAFIPGVIREVYVKIGDNVKIGDKLLVLEAMKMRNTITSPLNGKIRYVAVSTGKSVAKNELLIEFE
jgi:biotin carboxyl carrier protein